MGPARFIVYDCVALWWCCCVGDGTTKELCPVSCVLSCCT
jgi:hypothetical protein